MSTQNLQKLKGWKAQIQQFMHILGSTPTTSQDLTVNPLRLWKKVSLSRYSSFVTQRFWRILAGHWTVLKKVTQKYQADVLMIFVFSQIFHPHSDIYLSPTPSPINSAIPLRTLQRTAVSTDDKLLLSPGLLSRCLDGPTLMIRLANVLLSMLLFAKNSANLDGKEHSLEPTVNGPEKWWQRETNLSFWVSAYS